MKCNVCKQDYSNALRLFKVHQYDTFIVKADVFTAETLQLIFDYVQINQLSSFSIIANESKIIKCAGCQELNIMERVKRRELLNLPEFNYINHHDFM
ncbi:MAG: hypothetical protein ABS882_06460 [Lysinibacillus sp.]